MHVLYISHCVPWPPDKGDRIRAFHSVKELTSRHQVHVACLARSPAEAAVHSDLRSQCASVCVELLDSRQAFLRGLARFATGGCFSASFYWNPALDRHIRRVLAAFPISAVIILSSGMALYAPDTVPWIADWGDVDSEKWFQYASVRFPGCAYRLEGGRLRNVERAYALRSRRAFFTTPNELRLFQIIEPAAAIGCAGNGVDFEFFDPRKPFDIPADLRGREFLVFVGVLNYFPNSSGVCRFGETVFPELRRRNPKLELFLVGRNPSEDVLRLGQRQGITVTGTVDDVRPYLAAARAVIAPLQIARGIQNKVLEALAMGKTVFASEEVCRTFEPDLPIGIMRCRSMDEYALAAMALRPTPEADIGIREHARSRFSWTVNLSPLLAELEAIETEAKAAAVL
jgi:sugar transferase (PEP-CTERM/EpsH1 system associated)